MDFSKKKEAYASLQNPNYLQPDLQLLRKYAPRSRIARKNRVSQSDVVWALLDHASGEEIRKNRKKFFADEEAEAQTPVAEKLSIVQNKAVQAAGKVIDDVKKKMNLKFGTKSSSNKKKKNTQT